VFNWGKRVSFLGREGVAGTTSGKRALLQENLPGGGERNFHLLEAWPGPRRRKVYEWEEMSAWQKGSGGAGFGEEKRD